MGGSDTHSINKDTLAPVLTIDDPLEIDNVINDSEKGTFVVSGTGEDGLTVNVAISGSGSDSASTTVSGGTWSVTFDVSSFTDGNIAISATETNTNGNTATASHSVSLDTTTSPTINTPITSDNVVNSSEFGSLTVTGTGEAGSGISVVFSDGSATTSPVTPVIVVVTTPVPTPVIVYVFEDDEFGVGLYDSTSSDASSLYFPTILLFIFAILLC